jgi:hypothetical protein
MFVDDLRPSDYCEWPSVFRHLTETDLALNYELRSWWALCNDAERALLESVCSVTTSDDIGTDLDVLALTPSFRLLVPYLLDRILAWWQRTDVGGEDEIDRRCLFCAAQFVGCAPVWPELLSCLGAVHQAPAYTIMPTYQPWYLCMASEGYLLNALEATPADVVLVDGSVLVKINHGKLTGLCLYPLQTPTGLLLPGMWYSPVDESVRDALLESAERNETTFTTPGARGSWAIMRAMSVPSDTSPAAWLARLRAAAAALSDPATL